MRICTKSAAVERGEDSGRPAQLRIMDGGVGLVPVDVERAAAGEIEQRIGIEMSVVTAAHDRAPAVLRHDERERGRADVAGMDRDGVFRGHLQEHASEPVIRDRGEQIRRDRELRAAEGGGDGVAAERDRVGRCHVLFIADRKPIGQEGDVDVSLADEESLHGSRDGSAGARHAGIDDGAGPRAAGFGTKVAVFSITGAMSEPCFRFRNRASTKIRLIVRCCYMGTEVSFRNHARKIIAVASLEILPASAVKRAAH